MKLFLIALLTFAIGLAAGLHISNRQLRSQLCQQAIVFAQGQRLLAFVSLTVLEKLQADRIDQAKSLLARQVATYYQSLQQLDTSPEKQELVHHIETSSNNSPE